MLKSLLEYHGTLISFLKLVVALQSRGLQEGGGSCHQSHVEPEQSHTEWPRMIQRGSHILTISNLTWLSWIAIATHTDWVLVCCEVSPWRRLSFLFKVVEHSSLTLAHLQHIVKSLRFIQTKQRSSGVDHHQLSDNPLWLPAQTEPHLSSASLNCNTTSLAGTSTHTCQTCLKCGVAYWNLNQLKFALSVHFSGFAGGPLRGVQRKAVLEDLISTQEKATTQNLIYQEILALSRGG